MYIKINTTWNNWLMYFSWLSKINKYRPFSLTHLSNLLWSHSFLDDKLFYSWINANLSLGKRWKGGRALWLLVVYHLATLELISYIKSGNPCLLSLSQRRTKSFSFSISSRSVKTSKINPPPPPCSSRPWNCYHQTLCLCICILFQ